MLFAAAVAVLRKICGVNIVFLAESKTPWLFKSEMPNVG